MLNWIKSHKILSIIIAFLLLFAFYSLSIDRYAIYSNIPGAPVMPSEKYSYSSISGGNDAMYSGRGQAAPTPDIEERKIAENSKFSLLVKNVTETTDNIKKKISEIKGAYTVSSNINRGEYSDTANIVIRVPVANVEEIKTFLRDSSVKVISENIERKDITDSYVDIERRLSDLEKQRIRFEQILNSADTVEELMSVQNAIFQLQNQIDSYQGQLNYMKGITRTSKITIYLATDEMSLPYAPENPWKPEAVFKNAVRSLLTTLQGIGKLLIWVAVYSPLVLVLIVTYVIIKKVIRRYRK